MTRYVLAIDQGTTSTRAILFDRKGRPCYIAQKEVPCLYPRPGWVEVDALIIWSSVIHVVKEVLSRANVTFEAIVSIGIANQRETTVVWEKKTGLPIHNAIVWQSKQSQAICDRLKDQKDLIHRKTGLLLNPYFSASKIRFILDHVKDANRKAKAGELCFGTIDSWLIYKMTEGRVHATDVTNASRTMLFNIHDLTWDDELLALFDLPRSLMPEVKETSGDFGEASYFKTDVRITGVAGDQQASLFGENCFQAGTGKNTYGTGCFLLMNTGTKPCFSKKGLLTTIAWKIKGETTYALEGSVLVGGAVVQWLRDEAKFIKSAAMSEDLATSVSDEGGVIFLPAFSGLGTPYWDDDVRGSIFGLTRASRREHIVRAALEGIAFQCQDVLAAMSEEAGVSIRTLAVDGGAAANEFLLQFQSDISRLVIRRPACLETTALGAAFLAGLAVGFWPDLEAISKTHQVAVQFEPKMPLKIAKKKIAVYHQAVMAARLFAQKKD